MNAKKKRVLILWPEGQREREVIASILRPMFSRNTVELHLICSITFDVEQACRFDSVIAHYPGRWPKEPMPAKVFEYARALDEIMLRGIPVGILYLNLTKFPFPWPKERCSFLLSMTEQDWRKEMLEQIEWKIDTCDLATS